MPAAPVACPSGSARRVGKVAAPRGDRRRRGRRGDAALGAAFWDDLVRAASEASSPTAPAPRRRAATARRGTGRCRDDERHPPAGGLRARPRRAAAARRVPGIGLHVAPRLRRRRHLPHPRRRLDPRLELREALRRRRGGAALRRRRRGARRLPDPRRHHQQLRRRAHAVGHLALVRGVRRRAGLGVRPGRPQRRPRRTTRWACSSTRPPRWTRAGGASTSPRTSIDGALLPLHAAALARPVRGLLELAKVGRGGAVEWVRGARPARRARADPPPGAGRTPSSRARRASGSTAAWSTWPPPPTRASTPTTPARERIEVIYDGLAEPRARRCCGWTTSPRRARASCSCARTSPPRRSTWA